MDDFLPKAEVLLRGLQRQPEGRRSAPRDVDNQRIGRRREPRLPVVTAQPVEVRLPDVDPNQPATWWTATVLDISPRGMAVLIHAREDLQPQTAVLIGVQRHRDFGVDELAATIRWSQTHELFTVLGLEFLDPLPRTPDLASEIVGW